MSKKNIITIIVGILIGMILLGVWASYVNVEQMMKYLQNLRINYVVYASLFYISAYFIRATRWSILLNTHFKVSLKRTFLYAMAGNFLNYMIPIRAGEVAKSYFLKKSNKIPYTKSFPSIFVDKVFDTLGIFFVLILIPFVRLELSPVIIILLILLLVIFLIGFGIILLAAKAHGHVSNFLKKFFFWLPERLKGKVYRVIELVVEGTGLFHNHLYLLLPVILLTALGIVLDAVYFNFIFLAFNLHVDFLIIMLGYTLINLSYVLPQPPAQLGSNEWMMVIIFAVGFGLLKEEMAAIMAFAHVLTAVIMTVFGIISLSYAGIKNIDFLNRGDELNDESQ
ncbi:MAG TPA: lysylphosphatidylglycerol synthase transmembrane domain-containing protein [Candidatus Cloacimonadota bacterium]|nr:lysylphosphatidylglycerol synthase transmembrane domain-containing protein [Candidatus Cloacimonadota bacterium]HPT71848.1 lysylphosphatidylglycerol synthase transmembrane domain-containing protein [Candidatus Cloacimonadota bacterium]